MTVKGTTKKKNSIKVDEPLTCKGCIHLLRKSTHCFYCDEKKIFFKKQKYADCLYYDNEK